MSIVSRVVDAIVTLITAPFRAIAALFGRRGGGGGGRGGTRRR
ncbi:MAG: hypothetical protein ACR2LH_10245 [Thermoleophilaceae bacterium]